MKIQSTITGATYEFTPNGRGVEQKYLCPECSHLRKKKNDKCLNWNVEKNIGLCHNCNAAFFVYKPSDQKQYVAPEWKNITDLSDAAVKWFTGRMISQATLVKMKIYTAREYMPQDQAEVDVICIPYFFQEKLYNIKFRALEKKFKMVSGAELIFYNQDALLKHEDIIIVEGEIDALSFIQCGFDNVISVPNGAGNKLEYLDTYNSLFDNVKRIYLAVDQDTPGITLREELARRLGPERCMLVNFKDCKDANEYLIEHGSDFNDLIKDAIHIPTKGIVTVDHLYNDILDLYENGVEPGMKLDEPFDEFIKWETGRLAVVTGVPSCFTKEQLIHTSEGVKKISDIKEGDLVLSYSHERKIEQYKYVLNVNKFDVHTDKLYKIKLKDGTIIKVTGSHKFFTGVEYLQIEKILLSLGKDK